jgi:hypothetical protein
MDLKNDRELATTREKLLLLERAYAQAEARPAKSAYTRESTLHSLKGLINQLTEEIARYESRLLMAGEARRG